MPALTHEDGGVKHSALESAEERSLPNRMLDIGFRAGTICSGQQVKSLCEKGSGTVVRSTLRAVPATVPDPFSHRLFVLAPRPISERARIPLLAGEGGFGISRCHAVVREAGI